MGTNTGIGIGIGIPFKNNVLGEGKPYLPPEIKDSLKAVVIAYGKTNNDSDRAIVKNLVDASNPFVISNAAFKLNSGFGKYEVDFTTWIPQYNIADSTHTSNKLHITKVKLPNAILYTRKTVKSMKVEVKGSRNIELYYRYSSEENVSKLLMLDREGIYELPDSLAYNYTGFEIHNYVGDCDITITQIPDFEGAFVTDGVDDLITSTKTVQEMGITDEVTVVSMIHQIDLNSKYTIATTNYIENSNSKEHVRSDVYNYGKTGIYGYSASLINNTKSDIKNILGDEADYCVKSTNSLQTIFDVKFSVVGRISELTEASQVAWYWTIIANKVLTTDEINQVIAYFNLDKTLKPDILCNTIKQGITNENHAEFGDKLIDFSGNGRDIQLNNIAWKGDSGIGKYNFSNINIIANRFEGTVTTNKKCHFTKKLINTTSNFCDLIVISPNEPIKFKVTGLSDGRKLFVANKSGSGSNYNFDNGEHEVSLSFSEGVGQNNPFGVTGDIGDIDVTVEFIPSHAGALCLDGVNDFGKVTGMPVYKDYTFIIDYERISYASSERWVAGVVSKSHVANQGAFILMTANTTVEPSKQAYSFGGVTSFNRDDFTRALVYQSKYKCGDVDLTVGEGVDSNTLWLGTIRDNDSRFFNGAIYSLMSFPYSMSEFLIERQLKKYKLGTLYPNMVEFRPVIKANDNYKIFYTAMLPLTGDIWERINIGDYVPVGRRIAIQMSFDNEAKKLVSAVSSQLGNITIVKNSNNIGYTIFGDVLKDKSPQKISITIEQDENYVLFNPVINSNYKYISLDFFLNNYQKKINIGDYIPKDAYLRANLYLNNNVDELAEFTFNGVSIGYSRSITVDTAFNIGHIYNYDSPQEVNITIDEYIRYEDIVQPYPVLLRFNDESGKEVS